MKRLLLIAILAFPILALARLNPAEIQSKKEHLVEVNKEWRKHFVSNEADLVSFQNDVDRISFHLTSVIQLLVTHDISHLSESQLANRERMINVLRSYANAKVFPINLYHANRQPYFIDHLGTHCAVGYLLLKSGHGSIAKEISEKQNYAYVREIESPELLQWALDYGFALDELALIQPGYEDNTQYSPIGNGTNGEVTTTFGQLSGKIYFAGNFSQLNGMPCMNLGEYSNGQLSCLGDGVDGLITSIYVVTNSYEKIFLSGHFQDSLISAFYPLVKQVNGEISYIEIPDRPNAKGLCQRHFSASSFYIAIYTETFGYEVFLYTSSSDAWTLFCKTNGPINDIDFFSPRIYVVGDFSELTLFDESSELPFNTMNFAGINLAGNHAITLSENLPSIINSIFSFGNFIYLAGKASNDNETVLSRYFSGNAQPLLYSGTNNSLDLNSEILDLTVDFMNNDLILVGALSNLNSSSMTTGKGVFKYNLATGYLNVFGNFNDTVKTISMISSSDFIVGGRFTGLQNESTSLNHLAKYSNTASLDEANFENLSVYPNPTNNILSIQGLNSDAKYQIQDLSGKIFRSWNDYINEINVGDLSNGVYFLEIESEGQKTMKRFVKN